jgi:hypothetical protein
MGRAAVACRGVAGSRLQPADRWAVGVSQATEGRIEVGSANQAQAAASAILTRRGQGQGDGSPWAGLMGGRVGEAGGVRVEIRRGPRPARAVGWYWALFNTSGRRTLFLFQIIYTRSLGIATGKQSQMQIRRLISTSN